MTLAFPKPKDQKKKPIAVRVFRDGREVCNLLCKEGRDEYMRRKRVMWERQVGICCLAAEAPMCPGRLNWGDAMFEHEGGRGSGGSKRDDRIEITEEKHGIKITRKVNGVAHPQCNSWKGSRRIQYNEIVP